MKRTLLAGTALCLSACSASAPVLDSAAMQHRLAPVPVNIPKGQCALILNERNDINHPIFFQVLGRREAFIAVDKKQHRLTLRQAINKLENGVWLKQDLLGHRLSLSLTLRVADSGTREHNDASKAEQTDAKQTYRGVMAITKPKGWSNAIAIEGRTECRTRN